MQTKVDIYKNWRNQIQCLNYNTVYSRMNWFNGQIYGNIIRDKYKCLKDISNSPS